MECIVTIIPSLCALMESVNIPSIICCKKNLIKGLKDKIDIHQEIFDALIKRQVYDSDPARNDLFEFIILEYIQKNICIWEDILLGVSKNNINENNIYEIFNREILNKSQDYNTFLINSLKYQPAVVLINNYFSQFNEQIVANVSILTLTEKFDIIELVTILVDMHISLCHTVIMNSKANLPCINGHFDGIIFNSKLTQINHNLQKKEVFDYLKKIIKGFETQNNLFVNRCFNLFQNLITDPEYNDIIVHASSQFLNFLEYSNEEILGKNPKVLQYTNLEIPDTNPHSNSVFANKLRQNKTTIGKFRNFRKNGQSFNNTIIIKTIMCGSTPLYRFSIQVPESGDTPIIDEHVWKSYIDNVFVLSEPPLFSTIYKLEEDSRFKLINCFNFKEIINEDEFTQTLYIEDMIKIRRGGATKLYNIIHHLEDSLRTITLEHDFNNNNKTFHLKTVLYINKSDNRELYIFAVHREQ